MEIIKTNWFMTPHGLAQEWIYVDDKIVVAKGIVYKEDLDTLELKDGGLW